MDLFKGNDNMHEIKQRRVEGMLRNIIKILGFTCSYAFPCRVMLQGTFSNLLVYARSARATSRVTGMYMQVSGLWNMSQSYRKSNSSYEYTKDDSLKICALH